jgi:hypothetical protein
VLWRLTLSATVECELPMRWMPSPQSPGTPAVALHSGLSLGTGFFGSPPRSLFSTTLCVMVARSTPSTRMPSAVAWRTVNPLTVTSAALIVNPLFSLAASTVAPWRP